MRNSKLFKSLLAAIVGVGLGSPAIVLASTPSHLETNSIAVSYADLNLQNEEGVRVLYRRLRRASKGVCGDSPLKLVGPVLRQANQCYRETLTEAVEKVNNELLTRIHAG